MFPTTLFATFHQPEISVLAFVAQFIRVKNMEVIRIAPDKSFEIQTISTYGEVFEINMN
jgi:hypothetical protein